MSPGNLASRRQLALLSAALACVCALLTAPLAGNANAAATTTTASPSNSSHALHLSKPVSRSRVPTGKAKPDVSPFGTSVYFHNGYGTTVWVATERYNPGCYGSWENQGWYRVDPGQTVNAFTTTNEYAYFYAKAANGAVWSGNYSGTVNRYYAYDYCTTGDTNEQYVGMRQFDLGGWNLFDFSHTINLVP